ncbi:MAG: leucine-rich repeat domain-containing protein [Alphaproteobacteria bacterium]|nr:leucine-rich repeat domain-containing protein [Alphaproteobacteria bacterium]
MKRLRFLGLMIYLISAFANKTYAETWNCGEKDSEGNYGANVKCTLDENGNFTVSGTGNMADFGYVTDGLPVSTAPWGGTQANMNRIKNIVVESGVDEIGANAFNGARKAENIYMPGVKKIGTLAFYDPYAATSIYMPLVENIGNGAFKYSKVLESVDMPNVKVIGDGAFRGCCNDGLKNKLKYVGVPDELIVDENAFSNTLVSGCGNGGDCGNCGDKFVQAGAGCVGNCFDGYYPTSKGYCEVIKLRYTIPEADAATSDDFENTIEWIFE